MSLLLCPRYDDSGAAADGAVSFGDISIVGPIAAHFNIGNDGIAYQSVNSDPYTEIAPWIVPQVGMADYEHMASPTGSLWPVCGAPPNTWLPLSQSWLWGFDRLNGYWGPYAKYPDRQGAITVQIRRIADQVVVSTFTVSFDATGSS